MWFLHLFAYLEKKIHTTDTKMLKLISCGFMFEQNGEKRKLTVWSLFKNYYGLFGVYVRVWVYKIS